VLLLVPPLVPGTLSTIGASADAARGLAACAWLAWIVATVGTWLPHPAGLTAARCALPVLVALCAAVADGSTASIAGATAAVLAAMLSASAHFGQHFVQAGAYGDERRWLLRLPAPLALPTLIGWLVLVGPVVAAFALGGTGDAVGAGILAAVSFVAIVFVPRRLHRLSRRWLVRVPAGWVVHDDVALEENLLLRTVAGMAPAPADTAALDLTCLAPGTPLELTLAAPVQVRPTALVQRVARCGPLETTRSILVAPSLPATVGR
jgi:hypothetical protein